MRILHLHDAPHIHGGATAYLEQLLPQMAAKGHKNLLFSLDQGSSALPSSQQCSFSYSWPSSPFRRRRDFHRFHPPLAKCLEQWVKKQAPEVVHVQNCSAFRTTVFPTILKLGLPLVMTVHDFSLLDPNPWGLDRSGPLGPFKSWLDRQALEKAREAVFQSTQRFLCPTQALLNAVGFPAGKARLQRLPIAPASAPPLPQDRLRLFFAGTLFRSKGVDLLLEAMAGTTGALGAATLEIAGTGDQENNLKGLCTSLGLEQRVRFLGFCSAKQMETAYARANLQVLPSRVPENSPLTVLEAGARGRPALASHDGGVPELLAESRGWTFPSEDVAALRRSLQRIGHDLELLANTGARMRNWVIEEFAADKHWDSVDKTYHELTA